MADTPDAAAVQAAIERLRKHQGNSIKYYAEIPQDVDVLAAACEHYQRELAEYRSLMVDVVPGPDGQGIEVPATADTLRRFIKELQDEWDGAEKQLAAAVAERDHLAKFKAYVHKRLDDAGISHHPPGIHGAEGCRIGDRLDYVFARERGLREALWASLAKSDDVQR